MTTGASYDTKERPSRPAKERGGPLRHPDVITLPSPTTTHTPGARHHHPSSPTASFAPPRIVTQVVVQHHVLESDRRNVHRGPSGLNACRRRSAPVGPCRMTHLRGTAGPQ